LEGRLERESREIKERKKENKGRLKIMEEKIEREVSSRTGEEGMEGEWTKNTKGNIRKDLNGNLQERIKILEEKIKDGGNHLEKEDREVHVMIKLESEMARDRIEK
jgi:hypothetical protein